MTSMDAITFQQSKEAFRGRIVKPIAGAAHVAHDAPFIEQGLKIATGMLRGAVRMLRHFAHLWATVDLVRLRMHCRDRLFQTFVIVRMTARPTSTPSVKATGLHLPKPANHKHRKLVTLGFDTGILHLPSFAKNADALIEKSRSFFTCENRRRSANDASSRATPGPRKAC